MQTCFHSDYMFWNIKMTYCKKQNPIAVYFLLKVSNKDTTGINESRSNWKCMTLFLRPNYPRVFNATFEHYLQMKRSILFSIGFIK